MKSKEKGFTLIEVIITFVIMSIVLSSVFLFFLTNMKNYRSLKTNAELQFHAQYIMNFVSNKVMESKKIVDIRTDGTKSVINSPREWPISKISLLYNEQNGDCYIFEVKFDKIFYDKGKSSVSANVELGTYISELCLAPYPEGKTFAETKALKITIKLVKDNQVYEANQIIYMRNS